tara:strand:- start:71 stop:490 length:420 start_codon:yes stop_codon:yes gene_type:complete
MAGQPTSYKEEYNDLAFKYCLMGATDERLAEFFDVCVATINNWKREHPEFLASIKRGKHDADSEVVNSLFGRAKGYNYTEIKDEKSEQGVKHTETLKHVHADTGAAIFWLKNRQPKQWRDKQEQVVVEMTHEQWLDSLE